MISREDFERRLAEAESNFTKARKQAERQAEANAFKDSNFCRALKRPVSNTKLLRLLHPV